jgi:Tol biopolymer transport system component
MRILKLIRLMPASALFAALAGCSDDGSTAPGRSPVAAVAIAPTILELSVGDTIELVATVLDREQRPLAGRRVVWRSSDAEIAAVDSSGRVVARNEGQVSIFAASEGREAARQFVVSTPAVPPPEPPPSNPPSYIELNPTATTLSVGGTRQLIALVKDIDGQTLPHVVTFSSTEPEVASISADGLVTAVAHGSTLIVASSAGLTALASVTVLAPVEPAGDYDLVYTSHTASVAGTIRSEAWRLDLITGQPSTYRWSVNVSRIVPSPDGTRFLVAAPSGIGMSRILVVNADGSGSRTLVEPAAGVHLDQPAWSPDGSRVAYRSYGNNGVPHDIWVVDIEGTNAVNLTADLNGEARNPTFSPRQADGLHRIAFAQVTAGESFVMSQIRSVREDGQLHRAITPVSGYLDDEPAWSPDGSLMVFVRSGYESSGDLWTVSPDGSSPRQLMSIDPSGAQRSPSWSPDQRFIAFTSAHEIIGNRAGDYQIYTVNPAGTEVLRRTSNAQDKISPAWLKR